METMECDSAEYLASLMNGGSVRKRFQGGNFLRRSSLFSLYAKVFRVLLTKWDKNPESVDETTTVVVDEYTKELEELVLPSNEEWRLKVYYKLVELQRENDADNVLDDVSMSLEDQEPINITNRRAVKRQIITTPKKWDWEPNIKVSYPLTPRSSRKFESASFDSASSVMLETGIEPGWRLRDILLAAKLLLDQGQDEYADEAEMRRVFGLVYDVLRYKKILDKALDDVGFWLRYNHLKRREKVVWLLLYDMQGRKFARLGNSAMITQRNEALREAGLFEIEKALLDMKTRLAASLSRLRIGGSALSLDELLPPHLRTAEGVTWGDEGAIASGWVNSAKLPSRRQFIEEMEKLGLTLCTNCTPTSELEEDQYVFDPICPKVINLHEKARERLAVSQLVRSYGFIFLERSLCVGAAALVQAIRNGKLCGPVILTHSLAPRHTSYLAELLADIEEAGRLLVFGLGDNRNQHQAYLEKLGIPLQRCKLFSERYTSAPPSAEIERATIVLATPPCSFTGVRDVVDLAIARGGDLHLLETLTSPKAESPQQPRALLVEQMATLKYALTKPNVQLLVYEVHTHFPSETTEMIEQAVEHANKMALDKFQKEHAQRKKSPPREQSSHTGKKSKSGKRSQSVDHMAKIQKEEDEAKSSVDFEDHPITDIPIPESDLFEISDLNDLYEKDCSKLTDQGSFIVVLKRKEMMQFNSLFMIKVAEAKGVFGEAKQPPPTPKSPELQQQVSAPPSEVIKTGKKNRKNRDKFQFERLTAPTHSTIMRVLNKKQPCPRHQQHVVHKENSIDAQKTSSASETKSVSLSSQMDEKSITNLHVELSIAVSNQDHRNDKDETDRRQLEKFENKSLQKSKKLSIIKSSLQRLLRMDESVEVEEEEIDHYLDDDDFNNFSSSSSPTNFIEQFHFNNNLGESNFPLKKSTSFTLSHVDEYHVDKNERAFFNFSLKSTNLQRRRKIFPNTGSKLRRIKFQSRLEPVIEHSPGFSYLFPED